MERWKCEWVGTECGHHSTYTFYKAVKFANKFATSEEAETLTPQKSSSQSAKETWKVLSLGQFFFVKIWAGSDLLSVAELQLLWEDKATGQMMSSVRLYLLPEYTAEGRQPHHGEDELVAVSEKSVLRVGDLLDWQVTESSPEFRWDRGTRGVASVDCDPSLASEQPHPPGTPGLDLTDVERVRAELGDAPGGEEVGVRVLSSSQYCRFRAVVKRLDGCSDKWLRNSLVIALGGFATRTRNTFVMFAKETFDYPELEEHPLLCNHLAPKLKGRPRKRRKLKEVTGAPNSPDGSEHESNSSEGSNCSAIKQPPSAKSRKDLLAILSQKNTKEETEFLKKLIKFMEERNTPIERPPMLGFKQIDLHMFFQKVVDQGGYEGCVSKKAWKSVYDELGGNPQNTSAATCTRRHYEKFLLSYERYCNNMEPGEAGDKLGEEAEEEEKQNNGTNGVKEAPEEAASSESDTKEGVADGVIAAKEERSDDKPKEFKIGIKPLQLLTEPKLAEGGAEDVKMKIDDLIIIPNNINHAEEGGSALQNLAKIASRYSSLNKDKNRSQDFSSPSPKKARVSEAGDTKPGVAQPLPPTTAAKKPAAAAAAGEQLASSAASSLLQQFSLLSPAMFPGWPGPGALSPGTPPTGSSSGSPTPSSRSATTPSSAAGSWLGAAGQLQLDPAKIGQDGYNLLKYYEQQLKALQAGTSPAPPKANGVKEPSPAKKESKSKEKAKVSKLPPETKRPPRLLQTPCPYSQTASIYGSPQSELQKARDSATKSNNNTSSGGGAEAGLKADPGILDLSSSARAPRPAPAPVPPSPRPAPAQPPRHSSPAAARPPPSHGAEPSSGLNLSGGDKRPPSSLDMTVDLSLRSPAPAPAPPQVKASPFSAEALLSKPSPNNNHKAAEGAARARSSPALPPLSMGIKGLLEPDPRAAARHSPQPSPGPRVSTPGSGRVASPWHSPAPASKPGPSPRPAPVSSAAAAASLAAQLYGYPPASSLPGLSTETTFSSLSSLSSSSLAPPTLPSTSNPYLSALMSPALAAKPPPGLGQPIPGLNPLDPASQYYAALYQQQLSAYQHAASAAALNPYAAAAAAGMRPGAAPGGYPPAPGPGVGGAGAAAELAALQQYKDMMTRAALGGAGAQAQAAAASQAQAAAAAAANPYAALYGLMGYPGGFPGPAPGGRKDQ